MHRSMGEAPLGRLPLWTTVPQGTAAEALLCRWTESLPHGDGATPWHEINALKGNRTLHPFNPSYDHSPCCKLFLPNDVEEDLEPDFVKMIELPTDLALIVYAYVSNDLRSADFLKPKLQGYLRDRQQRQRFF